MIDRPPLDFIVLAYPRSGTTWLANWLTTDASVCLHDPWGLGLPATWPRDTRRFGISCTGSYALPEWLHGYRCPIAIIERDRRACDASLDAMGLLAPGDAATAALDDVNARRFRFDDLWDEAAARSLWGFLLPAIPFDALRWRLLQDMQIQPHMGKYQPDEATIRTLLDGGHFHLQARA